MFASWWGLQRSGSAARRSAAEAASVRETASFHEMPASLEPGPPAGRAATLKSLDGRPVRDFPQREQNMNSEVRWWQVFKRSEEHTSELQSRGHLVCRLLLEKKNNKIRRKQ